MRVLKAKKHNLSRVVKKAVKSIKQGKVIICPTDTVYGLCCNALDKKAVEKLFKIKKRSRGKPISIFVKDLKMARKFARVSKYQEKFLEDHRITSILETRNEKVFPEGIVSKDNKVGIRIPNYKFLNILLKNIDLPLTGTSANISNKPASTKIKEVMEQFRKQKNRPDLILDAGNLKESKPSKVIDLSGSESKILRA